MNKARTPLRRLQFEQIVPLEGASFYVGHFHGPHDLLFWHYHPAVEIALITEGRGVRFVGDSVEPYGSGDLCLVGENLPHAWFSEKIARLDQHSMVVQFRSSFLGPDWLKTREFRLVEKLLHRASRGLCFHGETRKVVTERLLAIARASVVSWREVSDLVWVLGTLAESTECSFLSMTEWGPQKSRMANGRLNQIFDSMQSNAENFPTQSEVAEFARLSPQAFSRFFKQATGKTFVQYRNEIRLGKVCRLLVDTENSIAQVGGHGSGLQ